ncbi:hypothetical protein Tco_0003400 [Tanacetum coccineum]
MVFKRGSCEGQDMALPPRDQRHPYLRFKGLEYTDAGISDFEESWALQFQLGGVRPRMSWREFNIGMGLPTMEEMKSARFGAYWTESARQIPDKGDLSAYWVGISSTGDFFGTSPSYTLIRDPMLRLCHRLIACSIAGRSQAPEKFVAHLAEHFGLLIEQRLQGLTVIVRDLPVIDMAELVVEGASDIAEGAQAVPAPVQAPQPPPAVVTARSLPQRVARLKEEVHGMRGALGEKREVFLYGVSWFLDTTTSLEKKSTMLVKYRSSGILCVL